MAVRTLADVERDIAAAYDLMVEYRALGETSMADHHERWMNVKLDEWLRRASSPSV